MHIRQPEVVIDEKSPFQGDKLDRREYAELLTKVVSSSHTPFVLAIDSRFGTGKTTFIRMWEQSLKNSGHLTISFNAWEDDFVEDPFVAFVAEMERTLDELSKSGRHEADIGKIAEDLAKMSGRFAKRFGPTLVDLLSAGLIKSELSKTVSEILSNTRELASELSTVLTANQIRSFKERKDGLTDFKAKLKELADSLSSSGSKLPVVFF